MTAQERQQVLEEVRPGSLLRDLRFTDVGVRIRGLRAGVVPDSSPLAAPDTRTFVTTHPGAEGRFGEELTLALEDINGDGATLELLPHTPGVINSPHYLREAVENSAEICHVREVRVDPDATPIPEDVLKAVGFHAVNGDSPMLHFTM
jgi:hypothetical protein